MGPGNAPGFWIKDFEPNSWLLWWDRQGDVTWLWSLDPTGETQTSLITRVRIRYRWTAPSIIFSLALDVGDIIMMRKCLLGIKRRTENRHDG